MQRYLNGVSYSIWAHGMPFHLLQCSFRSAGNVVKFSCNRSDVFIVQFIPTSFFFYVFEMESLLICTKASDLCMLTLDLTELSQFCNILAIDFFVFQGSKYKSINGVNFKFSYFLAFMPLLFFWPNFIHYFLQNQVNWLKETHKNV